MRAWARCLTQQRHAQRVTQRELLLPLGGAVNRRVPRGSFTCGRRTVVQWSGSEGDGEGKNLSFIQRQTLREKEQEAQRERQLAMVVEDWRRRNPDQGEPPPGELMEMTSMLDDMTRMYSTQKDGALPDDARVRTWFGIPGDQSEGPAAAPATAAPSSPATEAVAAEEAYTNIAHTPPPPHSMVNESAPPIEDALVSYWMAEKNRGALILGGEDAHPSTEQAWEVRTSIAHVLPARSKPTRSCRLSPLSVIGSGCYSQLRMHCGVRIGAQDMDIESTRRWWSELGAQASIMRATNCTPRNRAKRPRLLSVVDFCFGFWMARSATWLLDCVLGRLGCRELE